MTGTEPEIRELLADHFGVDAHGLGSLVSLRDDLAADSLDLVELAQVLEAKLGIVVPDDLLDAVRTVGDLVEATIGLLHERAGTKPELPQKIRARVLPREGMNGTLDRSGDLTPYVAETLVHAARRAGAGSQLDITVALGATEAQIARVTDRFAELATHGIQVTVRRHDRSVAHETAAVSA